MLPCGIEAAEAMGENETVSRPAVSPELVVGHAVWREALGQIRDALSRPRPVVAILGPPGTGKTLLLRTLSDELRADGRTVVLLARGDTESRPASPHGIAPGSPPGLVLVDEADRIDHPTLRALTEAGARGIVLAALPAFADRLDAVPNAAVVTLRALRPEEAASFVRARLAAAGTPDRLTGDALAEVVANGAGVPRLLCGLLTAAEFVAALQGAPCIAAEHVQEAMLLRGDIGADAGAGEVAPPDTMPDAAPASPPAESEEAAGAMRGPTPGERWTGSSGTAAVAPARRRARLWVVLACAVLAALFVAYAAKQIAGERLGRWVAALQAGRASPSPATDAAPAAPASPPLAVEVASNQATGPAPDPGPTPPAAGLPRGVVPHVVLSYRQGDAEAERRAAEAARALRAAGIAANDPVPVLQRIASPGVTYFFAEDRAGAAEVSRALGGAFGEGRAVSLRPDESLPRPGTIEIQISSEQAETAEQAR
jgi:type II secretory pathway predicted ATPase ExeA